MSGIEMRLAQNKHLHLRAISGDVVDVNKGWTLRNGKLLATLFLWQPTQHNLIRNTLMYLQLPVSGYKLKLDREPIVDVALCVSHVMSFDHF